MIITAEEFEEQNCENFDSYSSMMVAFAKLHVQEALKQIYEESKHGDEEHQQWLKDKFNSYPLENIK